MTTQELKEYINKVLGSSIRCLLPSYWWKKVLNVIVDVFDTKADVEYVDKIVYSLKVDVDGHISNSSTNPVQNKVVKRYVDAKTQREIDTLSGQYLSYSKIYPDKYYIMQSLNSITIASLSSSESVYEEFLIEIRVPYYTGSWTCTVSFPEGVQWLNGIAPDFRDGYSYQISIVNNIAVFIEYKNDLVYGS